MDGHSELREKLVAERKRIHRAWAAPPKPLAIPATIAMDWKLEAKPPQPDAGLDSVQRMRGISYCTYSGRWLARVREGKSKVFFYGKFDTPEEAHEAYKTHATAYALKVGKKPQPFYKYGPGCSTRKKRQQDAAEPAPTIGKLLSMRDIQLAVACHFGISYREMLSKGRGTRLTRPRQIAMYLCKKLTPRRPNDIARAFLRDHSSTYEAILRITDLAEGTSYSSRKYCPRPGDAAIAGDIAQLKEILLRD